MERGYDGATVRSIAQEAGVDHAMVNYWFGSKEGLLRAVMDVLVTPGEVIDRVLAQRPDDLATALLTAAVSLWDRPEVAEGFRALLREGVAEGPGHQLVQEYIGRRLVARLEEAIGGRDAAARAVAAAAIMSGLLLTRYVLRIAPIARLSGDEVVRACAPSLRIALEGSRPRPRSRDA